LKNLFSSTEFNLMQKDINGTSALASSPISSGTAYMLPGSPIKLATDGALWVPTRLH
jgi:hypothetical protein